MVDHDRHKVAHAERIALDLCLMQEFGRDDDRCRMPSGFEPDAIMHTARCARPSVADCGQHNVVIGGDGLDQRRIGLLGKAFLAVIVDCGKGSFFLQLFYGLVQQAIGVPFGIVEHAQTQPVQTSGARRKRQRLGLDHTARVEDQLILCIFHREPPRIGSVLPTAVQHSSLFSLFFPQIYSERRDVLRRNPGSRTAWQTKEQRRGLLFFYCFMLFSLQITNTTTRLDNLNPSRRHLWLNTISQGENIVNKTSASIVTQFLPRGGRSAVTSSYRKHVPSTQTGAFGWAAVSMLRS